MLYNALSIIIVLGRLCSLQHDLVIFHLIQIKAVNMRKLTYVLRTEGKNHFPIQSQGLLTTGLRQRWLQLHLDCHVIELENNDITSLSQQLCYKPDPKQTEVQITMSAGCCRHNGSDQSANREKKSYPCRATRPGTVTTGHETSCDFAVIPAHKGRSHSVFQAFWRDML